MNKGFLKEVSYRIDYIYLPDVKHEKFYSLLYEEFKEKLSEFQIKDVASEEQNGSLKEKAYVLFNPNNMEILTIARGFIKLVAKLKQTTKKQYNTWVSKIIKIASSEELQLSFKKFEIRKNNRFFIESNHFDNLKKIFKTDFSYDDDHEMKIDYMDNKQIYKADNAYFAILTKISSGILSDKSLGIYNKEANLIGFDFVYYSKNEKYITESFKKSSTFLKNVQEMILERFDKMIDPDVKNYFDDRKEMYAKYNLVLID